MAQCPCVPKTKLEELMYRG